MLFFFFQKMSSRTHLLIPSFQQHHLDIQTPALAASMCLVQTTNALNFFFSNILPSVQLHQLSSISQLHE